MPGTHIPTQGSVEYPPPHPGGSLLPYFLVMVNNKESFSDLYVLVKVNS